MPNAESHQNAFFFIFLKGSWLAQVVWHIRFPRNSHQSAWSYGAEGVYRSSCVCSNLFSLSIVFDWILTTSRHWQSERQTAQWLYRHFNGKLQCMALGPNYQFQHNSVELSGSTDTNSCCFLEHLLLVAHQFKWTISFSERWQYSVRTSQHKFQQKYYECNVMSSS